MATDGATGERCGEDFEEEDGEGLEGWEIEESGEERELSGRKPVGKALEDGELVHELCGGLHMSLFQPGHLDRLTQANNLSGSFCSNHNQFRLTLGIRRHFFCYRARRQDEVGPPKHA